MEKCKIFGRAIRQAREEKEWTRQELADKMGIGADEIGKLEDDGGNIDIAEAAVFFFLLNISPDILMYEDDVEDALMQDRMFRELQKLRTEQLDRLYRSVQHVKRWRKNHPEIVTVEDYQKVLTNGR